MAGMREIAKLTGLRTDQIGDVFDAILNLNHSGERVIIRGFGSFWAHERPARTVVSTALKGGKAVVAACKVIRYRSARATRRTINARGRAKATEE